MIRTIVFRMRQLIIPNILVVTRCWLKTLPVQFIIILYLPHGALSAMELDRFIGRGVLSQ
jgi:hypothetical protein